MSTPLVRQGYHPKDEDYYLILDVDFNAPPEVISSAYRNLARKFHPDKHQDERSRKEAEVIFHKIKTAYDVLSDPRKRKIYDTLGPDGLKLDGWKLVRKQMTAEEIREEFMRLQKQSLDEKNAIKAKPRASFTMSLDASQLFRQNKMSDIDENDDDNEFEDGNETLYLEGILGLLTAFEIRSLSTSMAVDSNIETNHTLTLTGNLSAHNGVGEGMVGALYRYKYSSNTQYSLLYQVGRGPVLSLGCDHKLNDKTSISGSSMILFDSYYVGLANKITITHKIRNYLLGKLSFKNGANSAVTTSLIYVNEKLMLQVTLSYKLSQISQSVSTEFGYRFNNDESKLAISFVASDRDGLAVEYGCETRVFNINTIGASLAFSLPAGVTLKLRYNRASQEFVVPIYLSDEIHSGPVFYGTMVPLVAYYVFDRCYLKHHKQIH